MDKGLTKRINCRYGTLIIHYNLEFVTRLIKFGERYKKIHSRVEKYRNRMQNRGKVADLSGHWRMLAAEFDRAFGKGACRIVFGGDMVSTDMMKEFCNKMTPYFAAWQKEFELSGEEKT